MRMSEDDNKTTRGPGLKPALAGFLGVFIASLCCLPLIGVALGTLGGLGLIVGLATYRIPLTVLGVGVFLVGAYQYYQARKRQACETPAH